MLVEIRKLGKKYHSKANYAVRDINIVGNEGEIIGILGHNGAGKSTTIKWAPSELQDTILRRIPSAQSRTSVT